MAKYNYLEGRPADVLWLMFRGAIGKPSTEAENTDRLCYMDGKDPVWFMHHKDTNRVEVAQPGVCLLDKVFVTNNTKTKWEQV